MIVSYFEWVQGLQQLFWDEAEVMNRLYLILDRSFEHVMARALRDSLSNRNAALAIGIEKLRHAKSVRGLFP